MIRKRCPVLLPGHGVSIQLVSPASGDPQDGWVEVSLNENGFPFNWYPQRVGMSCPHTFPTGDRSGFHSIGIPSEWGCFVSSHPESLEDGSFPFNWYPQRVGMASDYGKYPVRSTKVSIQLVSPASGDEKDPSIFGG